MSGVNNIIDILANLPNLLTLIKNEVSFFKDGEFNIIKIDNVYKGSHKKNDPSSTDRLIISNDSGESVSIDVGQKKEAFLKGSNLFPSIEPFRSGIHYVLEDPKLLKISTMSKKKSFIPLNKYAALIQANSSIEIVVQTLNLDMHRDFLIKIRDGVPVSLEPSWVFTPNNLPWSKGDSIALGHSIWTIQEVKFDWPYIVSPNGTEILTIRDGYCRVAWHIQHEHHKNAWPTEHYFVLIDINDLRRG